MRTASIISAIIMRATRHYKLEGCCLHNINAIICFTSQWCGSVKYVSSFYLCLRAQAPDTTLVSGVGRERIQDTSSGILSSQLGYPTHYIWNNTTFYTFRCVFYGKCSPRRRTKSTTGTKNRFPNWKKSSKLIPSTSQRSGTPDQHYQTADRIKRFRTCFTFETPVTELGPSG
jgi:hypothetical protein